MTGQILKYLKTHNAPMIEGNTVTFLWRGRKAPVLVGDITGWEPDQQISMKKSEPGIWTYQHTFEDDAYIEYSYLIDEESEMDPFNPQKTPNGVGGYNNYFSMPSYSPTSLARKTRNIEHGTTTSYHLPTDYYLPGRYRTVQLYDPHVDKPVPLLVVWDGQDYLHRLHLNYMVDNLISQGRIQPIAIAFVDNGGQELRTVEYACSDITLAFLQDQVLPLARKELNLINIDIHRGAFGVLGASMGGLMALYTGLRMPEVFGKVLSQSGAFTLGDFDMIVYELVRLKDALPISIWMDVGLYDLAGLLDTNQKMRDLLVSRGYPLAYNEYHAGHNYPAWRDDVWKGLETIFHKQD